MSQDIISVAIVDDHRLYRRGLINLIQSFGCRFNVVLEADHGVQFFELLNTTHRINIAIVDINMKYMDGFEVVTKLKSQNSEIKILVVSMISTEESILRMLRLGIKGYVGKDIEPDELMSALLTLSSGGYYYADYITGRMVDVLAGKDGLQIASGGTLNDRELQFLKLACSEDTYKEIADKMCVSFKTVDGYRSQLFEKLEVKSRVGLVLYAIKNNIVKL